MIHITLYQPEIAPNAGNVARTCAVLGCTLHLIRPLGFTLGSDGFRRAGMDYLNDVEVVVHPSWQQYQQHVLEHNAKMWLTSGSGSLVYSQAKFGPGDHIVFGRESDGLPSEILEQYPCLRLPMPGGGRSLNVAVSAAVVGFEALRQLNNNWQNG
jgi:tRNA (cytidine/uridine-2'-O-)-methyltransferase